MPAASAAATIEDLVVPDQTVADRVFDASLTLVNRGAAEDVVLVAALYDVEEGKTCGPAADPRFRAFTHILQDSIHLAADSRTAYPAPGERWAHRYAVGETPAGEEGEWCVFVARAPGATAQIQYEDFESVRIGVRATNAAPTVTFTWTPEHPIAAEPVVFHATAEDADGDPVALRWDFGFANASGQARAEGATPTARFYPDGVYDVTLVASDGFDETALVHKVAVLPEQGPATGVVTATASGTPLPLWVALIAIGLAMAHRNQRDPQ